MKNKAPYINPDLFFFDSLDELDGERREALSFLRNNKRNIESVFDHDKILILADPGYGKTRLLTELSERNNYRSRFISLKHKNSQEEIRETADLDIDVLLLDGIDEISADSAQIIQQIREISNKRIKIVISCRLSFYRKFALFENEKFKIAFIDKLDIQDVRKYLSSMEHKGPPLFSNEQIDRIILDLKDSSWKSIICIPRYLEKFVEYYQDNKYGKPTRSDLYNYFVNERLRIEDKKHLTQYGLYLRRFLEKLALLMEMYHVNEIHKDDLLTVLDDIHSNIANSILKEADIRLLYENSLLLDNDGYISFEERTLQEYLASQEILRLGRINKTVFDLVVDKKSNEIHPSWFNSLGFILDQEPSLLEPLIDYGNEIGRLIVDENYHKLLLKINTNRISAEQRRRLFQKIVTYYYENKLWIDVEIEQRLAHFYDDTLSDFLKKLIGNVNYDDSAFYVQLCVIAGIIGEAYRNRLHMGDYSFWKGQLIGFTKSTNLVLIRDALYALAAMGDGGDESVIAETEEVWKSDVDMVHRAFINLCSSVNPNSLKCLDYFIKSIKNGEIQGRYGLYEIRDAALLEEFTKRLQSDEQFLIRFVDDESIFESGDDKIINAIKSSWNADLDKTITNLIIRALTPSKWSHKIMTSRFILKLVRLLNDQNENLLRILLDRMPVEKNGRNYPFFNVIQIFSEIIDVQNIDYFIEDLKNKGFPDKLIAQIIYPLKDREGTGLQFYKKGREYFPDQFESFENIARDNASEDTDDIYNTFIIKLMPGDEKFSRDLFGFYLNYIDHIQKSINPDHSHELVMKAQKILSYDISEENIEIVSREDNVITQYRISNIIPIFGDCIRFAKKTDMDIKAYRQNIINYIPFAKYEELETLLKLLSNLEEKELLPLLKKLNESDDLRAFHPDSLIKVIERYKLKNASPLLKAIIRDEHIHVSSKRAALFALQLLIKDKAYFEKLFDQHVNSLSINYELAIEANSILIELFRDEKAIEWRMDQIKQRRGMLLPEKGRSKVTNVTEFEDELYSKSFAKPLMTLSDGKFFYRYHQLLLFSFNLLENDQRYSDYSIYIWDIILSYLEKLKVNKSYDYILKLEEFIAEKKDNEGINWFMARIRDLKRSYLYEISKPT
ncbi:MAG: NACHT domain-containing protein, partial [Candidatus Thorarchaeota archaeon]